MRKDYKSKRKSTPRKKNTKNKSGKIEKKQTKQRTIKKKQTKRKSMKQKRNKIIQSGGGFKVAININDGNNKLMVITRDFNNFDNLLKFAELSPKIIDVIGTVFVHYRGERYGYRTNWVRNSVCEHVHYVLWLKYGNKLFLAPSEIQHKIVKIANLSGAKDKDESIEDCAIRELKEEIGHTIVVGDIHRTRETSWVDEVELTRDKSGLIIDDIHGAHPNRQEVKLFDIAYIKTRTDMGGAVDENISDMIHDFVSIDDEDLSTLIMDTYKLDLDARNGLEKYLSEKNRSKLGFETIGTVIGNKTKHEISAEIIGQYDPWTAADTEGAKKIVRDILKLYGDKLSIYISGYDRYKEHKSRDNGDNGANAPNAPNNKNVYGVSKASEKSSSVSGSKQLTPNWM